MSSKWHVVPFPKFFWSNSSLKDLIFVASNSSIKGALSSRGDASKSFFSAKLPRQIFLEYGHKDSLTYIIYEKVKVTVPEFLQVKLFQKSFLDLEVFKAVDFAMI